MADTSVPESLALNGPFRPTPEAEVLDNGGLRVRSVEACPICGARGKPLYSRLRDRLWDAPGCWGSARCDSCGLVWLNPQPVPADIPNLYRTYYTHEDALTPLGSGASAGHKLSLAVMSSELGYTSVVAGRGWRWAGRLGGLLPPLRDYAEATVMFLHASSRGRVLDVGCGSGRFLEAMRNLGWEVQGIEPDPEAAHIARHGRGLPVVTGTLEDAKLPGESFDAISLHHVIEHVPDPLVTLKQCHRLLKMGGRLVVLTPCAEAVGHSIFGRSWFPLDPPRHLHLFSLRGLRRAACTANLEVSTLRTISRGSRDSYIHSSCIQRRGRVALSGDPQRPLLVRLGAWAFWAAEEALRFLSPGAGEEILLVAKKCPEPQRP